MGGAWGADEQSRWWWQAKMYMLVLLTRASKTPSSGLHIVLIVYCTLYYTVVLSNKGCTAILY